jgi:hypothetical protein
MPDSRALHTAVLLPSGSIWVAGGVDAAGNVLDTTLLVSAAGTVTAGPALQSPRVGHTATLLSTGNVLVAGGQSNATGGQTLGTTEVYDPTTNTISAGPAMTTARTEHTAVEFGSSGAMQVLIAGGSTGTTPLATAETFSETTNTFTSLGTATMVFAHAGGNAALLDNGSIMIEGGSGLNGASGAEIFNPTTSTFATANINTSRSGDAMASIGDEVVVGGGTSSGGVQSSTETYDVTTGAFAVGTSLANARTNATATAVAGSNVVFIGGHDGTTAVGAVELLTGPTLATGAMSTIGTLATARYGHTATALSTGEIIVIGGFNAAGTALASIEQVNATASASSSTTSSSSSGLLGALLGGSSSSGSSSGLGSLLSSLLGGGSSSSSSSSGLGGLLSGLLGGSSSSSSSGSGLGGIVSSLLGSLVGGSGSSSSSSGGLGSLLSGLFGGSSSSSTPTTTTTPSTVTTTGPSFASTVQPILNAQCTTCHSGLFPSGGVDLSSYNGALSECTPGNASGSTLYEAVSGAFSGGKDMSVHLASSGQATTIQQWINGGCSP